MKLIFEEMTLDKNEWLEPFKTLSEEESLRYWNEIREIIPIMDEDFNTFLNNRIISYLNKKVFTNPDSAGFYRHFEKLFRSNLKAYENGNDRFISLKTKYLSNDGALNGFMHVTRSLAYASLMKAIHGISGLLLKTVDIIIGNIKGLDFLDTSVRYIPVTLRYTDDEITEIKRRLGEIIGELTNSTFVLEGITDGGMSDLAEEYEKLETIHPGITDDEKDFLKTVFEIAYEKGIEFSLVTMNGAVSFNKSSRDDEWLRPTIDFYMSMVAQKCGAPAKVTHTISLENGEGEDNVSDKDR